MPDGIIPDEGLPAMIPPWFASTAPIVLPWKAFLLANDLTPGYDTTWADVIEPSWGGYHRLTLYPEMWSVPAVLTGCLSIQWATMPYSWTSTGPPTEQVYGWGILDDLVGVVRFIQRFDFEDILTVEPGGKYSLWPTFTVTSAACGSSLMSRQHRGKLKRKGR